MSQTTQKVFRPLAHPSASEPSAFSLHPPVEEARQGSAYAPALAEAPIKALPKRLAYLETYGCQMNFSDTEVVASLLAAEGYSFTAEEKEADVVLLNTCAIRDNAEAKVWHRLQALRGLKRRRPGLLVGLLGCMAERLKTELLDDNQLVDLVVGPDAYRSLPALLADAEEGQRAVNVHLSRDETYAELSPIRLQTNGVSAFVSIMRGCDNMCSFCVVPFTRGRERSRDAESILRECSELAAQGYREVTLLGQNVDSYRHQGLSFAGLLEQVAQAVPGLRVRFSTSHPKDMADEVLFTLGRYPNLCKYIHLPVQSGSSRILERMNRGYTRQWYLGRIQRIRELLPGCALSTDIITGFCSETEAEHQETLSLLAEVQFDAAYQFFYSERPGTLAARKYPDDVPDDVKRRRLAEAIAVQQAASLARHQAEVGQVRQVLIEGDSKRSPADYAGRTDGNKMVTFPKESTAYGPGSLVEVRITGATSATLRGSLKLISLA